MVVLGWILKPLLLKFMLKVREPGLRWNEVFSFNQQMSDIF